MTFKKLLPIFVAILILSATALSQQSKRDEGIDLYRAGNYSEAAARLVEATKADKMDRQAWLYLAAAYKHLDKSKDSTAALEGSRIIQKTGLPKYDQNVKIISKPQPLINSALRTSGVYTVAVELCSDGKVGVIIAFSKSLADRKDDVVAAAKMIRFEPAVKDGKPVTVIQVIEYKFDRH